MCRTIVRMWITKDLLVALLPKCLQNIKSNLFFPLWYSSKLIMGVREIDCHDEFQQRWYNQQWCCLLWRRRCGGFWVKNSRLLFVSTDLHRLRQWQKGIVSVEYWPQSQQRTPVFLRTRAVVSPSEDFLASSQQRVRTRNQAAWKFV